MNEKQRDELLAAIGEAVKAQMEEASGKPPGARGYYAGGFLSAYKRLKRALEPVHEVVAVRSDG